MIFQPTASINSFKFFLDSYSGAAAAYSLRRLRTGYTGNCIKVRRSNDNVEADIGFVNNKLDVYSLQSFIGSNSAFVTTWYDQSGNTNNAVQTTSANQPIIISSGSLQTVDGNPRINFNNPQLLTSTSSVFSTGTTAYTFVIVGLGNNDAVDGLSGFLQQGNNSTNQSIGINVTRSVDSTGRINHFWFGNDQVSGTGFLNRRVLLAGFWTGSSRITHTNTTIATDSPAGKNTASTVLTIGRIPAAGASGGGGYLNGYLQELICYNSSLSSNVTDIKAKVNQYYKIY